MKEENSPCPTCPFAGLTGEEKAGAVEGEACEMLCHESVCLDGDLPDRPCAGFHGGNQPRPWL